MQQSAKEKRKVTLDKEEAKSAVSDVTLSEVVEVEAPLEPEATTEITTDETSKDKAAVEAVKAESKGDKKTKRSIKVEKKVTTKAVEKVAKTEAPQFDAKKAESTFKRECSQCHGLDEIDDAPPKSKAQINSLIKRMVDNGYDGSKSSIRLIKFHMAKKYL